MYLDWHLTAHRRFAAYQEYDPSEDVRQSKERQFDLMEREIEQKYQVSKAQIGATIKSASIQASASRANAKTQANAQIKVANINQATSKYQVDVGAAVDREQIKSTAEIERNKILQAREEMLRIGIPHERINAWIAQKNYEIAKETLGLDIAKTAAEFRSTPDRYWLAADFEAVLPSLLNGTTMAGGMMNGPSATPEGAPTSQSLANLVTQLGGGANGTAATTGAPLPPGITGDIYLDTINATGEQAVGMPPGATSAAATGGQGNGKGWIDALTQQGIQAWGHLDLDKNQVGQGDVDTWFRFLQGAGDVDPNDPRVVAAAQAAKANGYDVSAYESWYQAAKGQASPLATPAATTATAAAPTVAPAATTAPAAGTTSYAGLTPQDATMLSGISAVMAKGLDPFTLDRLDPTQRQILLSGAARLGYDPSTELWRSETRRPGQGDSLLA